MTLAEAARAFLEAATAENVPAWLEVNAGWCTGQAWPAFKALRAAMAEHEARCAELRGEE